MTTPASASIAQNPPNSSRVTGCIITALTSLFAIFGVYKLVSGFVVAYVFSSARMLSLVNVAIILIIACECFIYFLLVFRLKRQHWLISLASLAVVWFVLPLALLLLLNISTSRIRVDGYAMGTTLPNQSYLLVDRLAYKNNNPQRGDIVIFTFPLDPDQQLLKRVIGLPGETLAVQDGTVTIDGVPLEESYITEPPLYEGIWTVPEGQFFVLGDNRNDSRDSHQWGFLPHENIIAKAVWIYYPLEHFGKIADVNYSP